MAKRDTRQIIAAAFMDMVKESSLSAVHVADLIAALSINRNTFYYHFSSKYDVALWIFRRDLAQELRASFPPHELVDLPFAAKDSDRLPYYVHVETGARTLDLEGFLKSLIRCVLGNRDFYRKLFIPQELEFSRSIINLYYPAFQDDILFILDGRYMPEDTRHLLALMCARQLVMMPEFFLEHQGKEDLLDNRVYPFWNILHESLFSAIQSHPINRYTDRSARTPRPRGQKAD